jgi:hypothetical protein
MLVPSLTKRLLVKKVPLAIASRHTSSSHQISTDLALMLTLQSCHELCLKQPRQEHGRMLPFTIASAAMNDPVLSETLNMMMVPRLSQQLPGVFELDFKKSDAFEDVFKLQKDEKGNRFLSVRDGLAEIRPYLGGLAFHRSKRVQASFEVLPSLSALMTAKFNSNYSQLTLISELSVLFTHISYVINANEERKMVMKKGHLADYKDFGLMIFGVKEGGVFMTTDEYCLKADLSAQECDKFKELIDQLN